MGWLFGWSTRKELIDHLCTGNGVETLKRKFVGNNMYAVQRTQAGVTFACIYLLRGGPKNHSDPFNWGYKDVDESMGPYQLDFPVGWLDLLPPTESEYAIEWRKKVRERAALLARLKVGTTWERADGSTYTIIQRRSPTSLRVRDQSGNHWRMTPGALLGAKELTCTGTNTTNAGSAPAACVSAQSASPTAA